MHRWNVRQDVDASKANLRCQQEKVLEPPPIIRFDVCKRNAEGAISVAVEEVSLSQLDEKIENLYQNEPLPGGILNSHSLAVLKALDQGIKFGFITSDPRRQTFKLAINIRRSETYAFYNRVRVLSENIKLYGLRDVMRQMEQQFSADSDDSTSSGEEHYDSDEESTLMAKKRTVRKATKAAQTSRRRRMFRAGSTPRKVTEGKQRSP
uniref:Uncharacterized protein n=1 Tax=Anopheles farauti TaxID=69004 RepID=A0A182QIW4_9DIPT